jgi:putative sterol carrier protein
MSEFWDSSEEVARAVLGMVERAYQDPVVRAKGEGNKNLLVFNYHDPDVRIWIDSRGDEVKWGAGDPPGDPDVQLSLSSDNAHRTWSNKFNVLVGITRKKIKVSGDATKVLKLTPLLKKFAIAYNDTLREMGKDSIILD